VVVHYTERHALVPFATSNADARAAFVSSAEFHRITSHRAGLSMSLFKRRPDPSNLPATGAGYSVLDAQLTVRGDIETEGTLRIDGRLDGSIRRADIVVIGTGATVVGDISAREVIVGGSVQGNVTATTRIELQPSAVVTGDIDAGAIMIQEGCVVQGRLTVTATPSAKERPAKVKTRAPSPTPATALAGSEA
jgi:cytoskeletal protein CcmA (bactofilin family)